MNNQTNDQIAAVMLQHGSEEQRQEALAYCSEGPDYSDGHDCEGFTGGCDRMGCPGGDSCTSDTSPKLTYLNPEIPHLAEESECVSMCLDDAGIPTHDSEGKELSLWGRVEEYAERRVSGKLEGGVRVHAFNEEGRYEAMQLGEERNLKHNATLILDD
jgi:hypothetical protein